MLDYEIRHRFRGETYHSIKKLLTEDIARNQCEFSFIIGQDNADSFDTWSNAASACGSMPGSDPGAPTDNRQ